MIVTTTPREVPADVIATAMERGAWACVAPSELFDAVAKKARRAGRRRGYRVQVFASEGRIFALGVVRGSCGPRKAATARREADDLSILDELISVVRAQAVALAEDMELG